MVAFEREAGSGLQRDELPAYAPMLAAFHRACAAPLRSIVGDLPIQPGDRILDMACGEGVYTAWLAERCGPDGAVAGVDRLPAYLAQARARAQEAPQRQTVAFQGADIARLPFDDGSFDLAWCAHSLYSLPDPLQALRELRRVARPGGAVAILENDTIHHHLLPWPADLELAVRTAQLASLERSGAGSDKFYVGRNLPSLFRAADFGHCAVKTYTIDHCAPLSDDERLFLGDYLRDLAERAGAWLDRASRQRFNALIDPASPDYLLDRADFFSSHLELLAIGTR